MDSERRGAVRGRPPYPILPASGPAPGSAVCLNVRTSCKSTSKHASARQTHLRRLSEHRLSLGKRRGKSIVALCRKRWQAKTFEECYPSTGEAPWMYYGEPMRESAEVATAPCLSAPRRIPPEYRRNDRPPDLAYYTGVAASSNFAAWLVSSSGMFRPAGLILYLSVL